MKIQSYFKLNLYTVKAFMNSQSVNKFDSHQFIEWFANTYESIYTDFLTKYKSHKTVHSQIAISLSKHTEELKFMKNGKVKSLNVFGNKTPNEQWIKN